LLEALLKNGPWFLRKLHNTRDEHKEQILPATALDLPGTEDAAAVGVDQNGNHLLGWDLK